HANAWEHLNRAVALLRSVGEPHALAFALALLAEAELHLGRPPAAERHAAEALELARPVGYAPAVRLALARPGDLRRGLGDAAAATELLTEAVAQTSEPPDLARTLEPLAAAVAGTSPDEARRLLDRATDIRRSRQTPPPPVDAPMLARVRQVID